MKECFRNLFLIGVDRWRMEEMTMKKSVLDRLETCINAAGITTRRNYINTERGPVPVLIAEHDYIGPYPTQEARDKLDTVRGICARYNVRRELRGYYQATYIREEVAPA